MIVAYIPNRSLNKCVDKTTYEIFFGLKPNLSKMHIFSFDFLYIHTKKTKNWPLKVNKVYLLAMKENVQFFLYFPKHSTIKQIGCVKFIDSFENDGYKIDSLLMSKEFGIFRMILWKEITMNKKLTKMRIVEIYFVLLEEKKTKLSLLKILKIT